MGFWNSVGSAVSGSFSVNSFNTRIQPTGWYLTKDQFTSQLAAAYPQLTGAQLGSVINQVFRQYANAPGYKSPLALPTIPLRDERKALLAAEQLIQQDFHLSPYQGDGWESSGRV
jgi:hypothetical protein